MPEQMMSPGIYFNEYDFSTYAKVLGLARLCILGAATKGDIGVPTEVSSVADLVSKFGKPFASDLGLLSAVEYLESGGQLVYTRIGVPYADDSVNGYRTSSRTIAGTAVTVAALPASGTIELADELTDGDTVTISDGTTSKVFEFDSNGTVTGPTNVGVTLGASLADTARNLATAINGTGQKLIASAITSPDVSVSIVNTSTGTAGNVAITKSSDGLTLTGMSGGTNATTGASSSVLEIDAYSPGTWGNTIKVTISTASAFATPSHAGSFDVKVTYPAEDGTYTERETFRNVNSNPSSERYVIAAINEGIPNDTPKSNFIKAITVAANSVPTNGAYTLNGTTGLDGIPVDDGNVRNVNAYLGSVNGAKSTGLKAIRNPERVEYNLLAIPGCSNATIIEAATALAEYRKDFVYLVDPPMGLTQNGVAPEDTIVAWHNAEPSGAPNAPTNPLTSSYAALSWSWHKTYSTFLKKNIMLPPSVYLAHCCAITDAVSGPVLPPAGFNRGVVPSLSVEFSPDKEGRDKLLGNVNRVNPFVDFGTDGIVLYGNKTLYRSSSKRAELHVRRMIIYAKKLIATALKYMQFDPNDQQSWSILSGKVNTILDDIKANRGLETFSVRCDATTTTPALQNRNTMKAVINLIPMGCTENIAVDMNLYASGASFAD